MKLSALAQATTDIPQSILVYGPPKSGKTYLVSKLVEAGYKLVWFDLENGSQTLSVSVKPEHYNDVELIKVPDTQTDPVGIDTIVKFFRARGPIRICDLHGKVACVRCKEPAQTFVTLDPTKFGTDTVVVVDSLSQLSDSAMAHAIGTTSAMETVKKEYSHFDKQGLLLKDVLSAMQQARFHVVFISHEESIEQEDGTERICPVGGTRNFSKKVGRYFGHVVYTHIKNRAHGAASSTTFNVKILSGSRSGIALEEKAHTLADLLKTKPVYQEAQPVTESPVAGPQPQMMESVLPDSASRQTVVTKPANPLLKTIVKQPKPTE